MKNQFNAICPIYFQHKNSNKIEHIGSGIFFQIKKDVFLLTVSHIIDLLNEGDLLVPCKDSISPIEGSYSFLALKSDKTRNDDMEEMGYFKLKNDFAKKIHNEFLFLTSEDILINNIFDFDLYTFSGFPFRKSRQKNNVASTEMYNYSGVLVTQVDYEKLNFDPSIHIVVKYNRLKTVNQEGIRFIPPLPHGISGGGIFAWPQLSKEGIIPENRQIIGIAHTYREREHLLIGTKIIAFVQAIMINNPSIEL